MSETKMTAAVAAANWWAEAIGSPKFDALGATRGQDRKETETMEMASMLAMLIASDSPVLQEAGAKFAVLLASKIEASLTGRNYGVSLGVDYGPDRVLGETAQEAGVSGSRFPWKTSMWVREDHVTVSAGYAAPTRLVWASDEWLANRPGCTSQKWDETLPYRREYGGEPFLCALPMYHEGGHDFTRPISLCRVCAHTEKWPSVHSPEDRSWNDKVHDFDPAPAGVQVTLPTELAS